MSKAFRFNCSRHRFKAAPEEKSGCVFYTLSGLGGANSSTIKSKINQTEAEILLNKPKRFQNLLSLQKIVANGGTEKSNEILNNHFQIPYN